MGCGASSAATDNPTAGYQPSADPAMDPAGQVVQGFSKELQSRGKADHAADDNKKYGDGAAQFVYRDCLTGGPCGGKSSSQDALSAALKKAGYNVYFAPEVPTILMNGARQPCRHHTARTLTITLSLPLLRPRALRSAAGLAASSLCGPQVAVCTRVWRRTNAGRWRPSRPESSRCSCRWSGRSSASRPRQDRPPSSSSIAGS